MNTGYSLHVGVNFVNLAYYDGREGRLKVAVNDMRMMADLASNAGFTSPVCLANKQATIGAFKAKVMEFAEKAQSGDMVLITYSGHGAQTEDTNGDEEEEDGLDENLCLYDGYLVDDRINRLFCCFREGVRILLIADCCHGGSISKVGKRSIFKPPKLKKELPVPDASVILLSGAAANQKAYENRESKLGYFTDALLKTWKEGAFTGNYTDFQRKLRRNMQRACGNRQSSIQTLTGSRNIVFEKEKPFNI
ncbi:MAG: caspase family protein [Bacteroidota bacterium]